MARAKNIFNKNESEFKDIVDLDDMRERINNTKMTGNINKNQELFRQALCMDNINSSTSNVRYIDGDVDDCFNPSLDLNYKRSFEVSSKITEEEFVDVMNELNESINKKYDNEIKL